MHVYTYTCFALVRASHSAPRNDILLNGAHRVAIALAMGFTSVPVTPTALHDRDEHPEQQVVLIRETASKEPKREEESGPIPQESPRSFRCICELTQCPCYYWALRRYPPPRWLFSCPCAIPNLSGRHHWWR